MIETVSSGGITQTTIYWVTHEVGLADIALVGGSGDGCGDGGWW